MSFLFFPCPSIVAVASSATFISPVSSRILSNSFFATDFLMLCTPVLCSLYFVILFFTNILRISAFTLSALRGHILSSFLTAATTSLQTSNFYKLSISKSLDLFPFDSWICKVIFSKLISCPFNLQISETLSPK